MPKRILAVDDSATMRQLLNLTLTRAGFEVVEAEDGSKGLQKATAETFDMVISDINMPLMTGLELLRSLRKLAQYKFTPIVLVTTESQLEKKAEGKRPEPRPGLSNLSNRNNCWLWSHRTNRWI